MIRQIIHINQDLCNGCGACASACHENAIGMVNGKARLLRDDYCDGLGDCLPACPTGAITFEQREAANYNEAATKANQQTRAGRTLAASLSASRTAVETSEAAQENVADKNLAAQVATPAISQLHNWPIQIKLSPVAAPIFANTNLLIAADCTAYAYANFHEKFMAGNVVLMGCPKLDAVNYADKLTQIFAENDIRRITLTRMEVPCCGGMEFAIKQAIAACGKDIPFEVSTISISGDILE